VVKVPFKLPPELMAAMGGGAVPVAPSTVKKKVLFVDGEMYGPLEFPMSFDLGRGQFLKLAGYGEVQVLEVTVDTLTCTKDISKELNDEYRRNPPGPDPVPKLNVPIARRTTTSGNGPLSGASCGIPNQKRSEPKYPTLGDTGERSTPPRFL
jgi:hypothetical protein